MTVTLQYSHAHIIVSAYFPTQKKNQHIALIIVFQNMYLHMEKVECGELWRRKFDACLKDASITVQITRRATNASQYSDGRFERKSNSAAIPSEPEKPP